MESLLVGLLVCTWYKAYISHLSVKDFESASVRKPTTYPNYWSRRLLNSSLYLLALFEQLFEASQINNLAQNS
jgi:hypothetical protein